MEISNQVCHLAVATVDQALTSSLAVLILENVLSYMTFATMAGLCFTDLVCPR